MTDIKDLTDYCLSCPNPLCQKGCPVGNHIRDFIAFLKNNDLEKAGDTLYAVNPYPELTSRLCDCARQCQGHCVRGIKSNPVQIQSIERYISDNQKRITVPGTSNHHTVAMIGAGPANLAAARYLLIKGCTVTIYDRLESAGGAILSGIPSYRFDKQYLADIQRELTDAGAVFHFSTEVGKDISFDEILQSYDRVLISCGAQIEGKNGLDGDGCEAGLSLLYQLNILNKQNEYKEKYHSALVWGGGNVAMDCARSLKRILNDVTVIYRRSEKEMPAAADEIEAAKQEGVHFAFLENIKELHHDAEGKVTGAHCIKMHLGEPDASGRARPIETEGSDYDIPCELVVPAIGQKVSFTAFDNIEKTDTHLSSAKHVYISGDAYLNPSTVAAAIKDGCDAAAEIDASFH